MGRRVNLGYIMLNHMIACCESTTKVLLYGRFLMKVFREFGLDLSTETESDKVYGQNIQSGWNINAAEFKIFIP